MANITPALLESVLHMSESEILDFKRDQYPFAGTDDEQKAELVKDILAFANAWKTTDAHILIGVDENPGQRASVVGVSGHLADADLQQLVCTKTNVPIAFSYVATRIDDRDIGVIRVNAKQSRPIHLVRKFGKLDADVVYIRRGSSTDKAKPVEIARMGATLPGEVPEVTIGWYDPIGKSLLVTPPTIVSKILSPRPKNVLNEFAGGRFHRMDGLKSPFEPTASDVEDYEIRTALMTEVALVVRNAGRIALKDVHVRLHVPDLDALEIEDEAPSKPQSRILVGLHGKNLSDTSVSKVPDGWSITVRLGKIHASDRAISDSFWIGSTRTQTIDFTSLTFCDELAEPIKLVIPLHVNARHVSRKT